MPSSKVREGTALMLDTLLTLAADPAAWAALLTLIALEVVLGIDNLIFISILSNKLPEHQRERARRIGIGLALIFRLALRGAMGHELRAIALSGPPIEHIQSFDQRRKCHGGVDVSLGHMCAKAIRDQHHSDH